MNVNENNNTINTDNDLKSNPHQTTLFGEMPSNDRNGLFRLNSDTDSFSSGDVTFNNQINAMQNNFNSTKHHNDTAAIINIDNNGK